MTVTAPLRELEESAFAAWPAEEVVALGGWRLRCTRGVTRRGNSVWPCALPEPDLRGPPLAQRLEAVESFYAERGLPAMFQLSPLATPAGLDQTLGDRGYVAEVPVSVQVAVPDALIARRALAASADRRVVVEPRLFPAWFEISGRRGRFTAPADIEVYQALLARLAGRAVFALAEIAGQPAAVALGVKGGQPDGRWMGIFSMSTLPAFRRRGAAQALLAGLAEHARQQGISGLYLQVDRENPAACALYAAAGFREAYGYHYRRRAARAA